MVTVADSLRKFTSLLCVVLLLSGTLSVAVPMTVPVALAQIGDTDIPTDLALFPPVMIEFVDIPIIGTTNTDSTPTEQTDSTPTEQTDSTPAEQTDSTPAEQTDSTTTEQNDPATEQTDSTTTEQNDPIMTDPAETSSTDPAETSSTETSSTETIATTNSTKLELSQITNSALAEIPINATLTESNVTLEHSAIELNQPVAWVQSVSLSDETDKVQVELPADAEIVTIVTSDGQSVASSDIVEEPAQYVTDGTTPMVTLDDVSETLQDNADTKIVSIDETGTGYDIAFETPAPYAIENEHSTADLYQKDVTVAHDSALHYTDVQSFSSIPEDLVSRGVEFKIFWMLEGVKTDVTSDERFAVSFVDTDGNGVSDQMRWIVPELSEQQFVIEGIILTTNAEHLDSSRNFVEDVYNQVSNRDGVFTNEIPAGDYIRVTFEENLNNTNDITIYAKSNYPDSRIEVYEKDSNVLLADFSTITEDGKYRILLASLADSQDTFDLKIVGNPVEFDYIVDPNISKIFVFATTDEGWVATKGCIDPVISAAFTASDGNAAGSLEMTRNGNAVQTCSNYWEYSGTWESLGVPAGSTVTGIRGGYQYKTAAAGSGVSWVTGPFDLRDSSGILRQTLKSALGFSGTNSVFIITQAISGSVLTFAGEPSSTAIKLRLNNQFTQGSPGNKVWTYRNDNIAVEVTYNSPPVLGAIGNKSVNELSLLSFTATATDADLPANTLTFSLDPGAPTGASITSDGLFTWTPTEDQGPGSYPITIRVTDDGSPNLSDTETITVTVSEVLASPVLDSIPPQSGDEDTLITFTATATDTDLPAQTLTFTLEDGAGSIPAGATITSGGLFEWTPTEAQGPGVYSFDVVVKDSDSNEDRQQVEVTVNEVNTAPILDAIGDKSVNELSLLSFTATATDADLPANTLTFSLDGGAPTGASITSGGLFTWTPTEDQGPGAYPITIRLTDNGAGTLSDSEAITVTVNEVGASPVLDSISPQSGDEDTLITFTATATDADLPAQILTFTLEDGSDPIPSGATITSGGLFEWTPTEAQGPGVYTFDVVVKDSDTNEDRQQVEVTVNEVNTAPVLDAIGDKSIDELSLLLFSATSTDADLPANILTFSLDGGAPTGASITSGGEFSWTPTEAQGPGAYPITIRITDDGAGTLSDSETITVTVNEVQSSPILDSIPPQSVNELSLLLFSATGTDEDLPAQTLTFTLEDGLGSIPAGATMTSGGSFEWTPTEAQGPGVYTFDVVVKDSDANEDRQQVEVTVNEVGAAPILDTIPPQSVNELSLLLFSATGTDEDLPAQTLTFTLEDGSGSIPAGASITSGGDFSWTPTEAQGPGVYSFDVVVKDPDANEDRQQVEITVNEVNTAPILDAIGDKSINELSLLLFSATGTDADIPTNTLTFSLDGGAPAGATITSGGEFSWTPTEAQGPGSYPITIRVTDDGSGTLSDSETITVTVDEVNAAPVLDPIGDKSINELSLLLFSATGTDSDFPANALTFSLDGGAPAGASITSGGEFSWTPTEDQGPGAYPITIRITDDGIGTLSDSEAITVTVNEVQSSPILDSIPPQSINELSLLLFSATGTDSDLPAQTLTFTLEDGSGSIPTGASITSGGDFSWTPTEAQGPGVYTFDVVVKDSDANEDRQQVEVTVNEVNTAPVLDAIGDKSIDELSLLLFSATSTDADLPANILTFSLDVGAPAGASITPSGDFSWTPTEAQGPGSYPITIRVTDDGSPNLSDTETITITVNEVNVAPVLDAVGDKSVDELSLLLFSATGTDSDFPANTVTFSLDPGAPAGASITSGGEFSWTPTEAQGPGTYPITIRVTDDGAGTLSDSETITVTVNEVNAAPVLDAIGNKSVDELSLLLFSATGTDADLPANTLSFSLDVGAPSGASITSGGEFSWTPTEAQGPGAYPITIRVTDDGSPNLSDTETITVTVNEVNTAPVLDAIGDKSINELSLLSFTATATDSDLPTNTLSFSLDGAAPAGSSITSGGDFTWTPTEAQGPGAYPITIRVTDDGFGTLSDSETISVTINEVGAAPILDTIPPQSINELSLLLFSATGTDSDLPPQTLTFTLEDGSGSIPSGATITSTGDFSWTPTEAQGAGVYIFDVVVKDSDSNEDRQQVEVTVNEVNSAPVLDPIGDKSIDELSLLLFSATGTDADIPANTLTFSLDPSAPAGASITSGGEFSWTPTEAQGPGAYPITIIVTDDGAGTLSDSEAITVTVNEVQSSPILDVIPPQLGDEDTLITFTATATDEDLPAQTLTITLEDGSGSIPSGATITSSGLFEWTPTEAQGPGIYSFDVVVKDSDSNEDRQEVEVTVNEINVAPVLDPIGDKSVDELSLLLFSATGTDADLPANTLTFSLDPSAPAGASITSGGEFSWTPTEAQGPGAYPITIIVTDDGAGTLSDSETITVTVNEVNLSPILDSIGDKSINELSLLSFTATATDSDLPANKLSFSLDPGAPSGSSITSGGAFTWTPTEDQGPGSYPITIRVTDDGTPNLSDTETITVTVNEVSAAPILDTIPPQSVNELSLLSFTSTATDPDLPSQTLTFTLEDGAGSIPAGASITSAGVFSWTPTEAQGPGVYTFDVVVKDSDSNEDRQQVEVTVDEVGAAPVLDTIPPQSGNEDTLITFTSTATDADLPAQTLTFTLEDGGGSIPSGASITSGGVFSWTPTESQGPGVYTFDVVVKDSDSNEDRQQVEVTVNEVNASPVLDAVGDKSINELSLLSFTATATDSDLPANTLSFSLDPGAPSGSSITSAGAFTWTPTEAQGPGSYPITIRVTDNGAGTLSDSEAITVTVNEVNLSPVLDPIGDKSINELALLSFTATATDSDLPANTLSFSLDVGAPAGTSITSGGVFSWTPTEAQGPGSYPITIIVTDDGAGTLSDSETITVTVNEANTAPILDTIGNKSITELSLLSFTATAADSDLPANTLTFSLDPGAPTGTSITSAGLFEWTPTEAQGPGSYPITIRVTDNGAGTLSDSEAITVTVNEANSAPTLDAIGNKSINELSLLSFTAIGTDSDLPANTLTFSLDVGAPTGASITSGGVFSWTPTEAQGPGSYPITIIVTDDGAGTLSDSEAITVTVNEVNVAPVLGAIGNKSVNELALLSFTATATDSDLPTNTLTFSLGPGAPSGASITSGGLFTWTPTEAQGPGSYPITIRVTDNEAGTLSDSETITVTVNEVNAAPVLAAIGNKSAPSQILLSFTATAADSDLPANGLTFSLGPGAPAGASITSGGVFTWTPTAAQSPGSYPITIKVTDNGSPNLSDTEAITVTVGFPFIFNGLQQPINIDGSSVFKQGSVVPVKFKLTQNGVPIKNESVHLHTVKMTGIVLGTEGKAVSPGNANTDDLFRSNSGSGEYTFNLSTKPLAKGTYVLLIQFDNPIIPDKAFTISLS